LWRIKILAQWCRSRHDEPPGFAMLNLTRLHLGIAHESQFQGLGISHDRPWRRFVGGETRVRHAGRLHRVVQGERNKSSARAVHAEMFGEGNRYAVRIFFGRARHARPTGRPRVSFRAAELFCNHLSCCRLLLLPRARAAAAFASALRQTKKTAAGINHAAGCCGPQAEARVTPSAGAKWRNAIIKGGAGGYDSRLGNREIVLSTLFCQAPPCPTSDGASPT